MLEARPYDPGDLAHLAEAMPSALPPCGIADAEARLIERHGWTLFLDGARVAVAMLEPRGFGTAHLSALVGEIPLRVWPDVRRFCRDVLERWQEDSGQWRRIEASARLDRPGHIAFLKGLGFKLEGVMEAYGADGGDCVLAARVCRFTEAAT